jgi:hypothetical protein
MEENPYQAPRENGAPGPPLGRQLLIFAVGGIFLVPACWALGRALIPPDDVALRFSVIVYVPAVALWLAYTCLREMIELNARKQLTAFTVALFCFVVAIVLWLVYPGDWLDGGWICLSVGVVAIMAGATLYRRRQG